MNCPNCGTPEQARVKVCPSCGTAYASQDLIKLRQLEFLLQETKTWPEADSLRQPYNEQLHALRARLVPPKPAEEVVKEPLPKAQPVPAPQPAMQVAAVQSIPAPHPNLQQAPVGPAAAPAQPPPPQPPPAPKVVAPPTPKKEAVPFDQWLLSERNIKIALYTGGLLLIIAGLIFVGANWSRMAGWAKFGILVAITAGMYVGGALLFKRRNLRLGGVALLAIASGFLLLDCVVLQIYEFRDLGLDDQAMWMICSILALLVYLLTAYWTRATLFIYLSIVAVASAATAGMAILDLPLAAYPLVYSVLAIVFLLTARGVRSTRIEKLIYFPLLIVSQIATPLLFLTSLVLWRLPVSDFGAVDRWLSLAAMAVGVLFYLLTDLAFHWAFARWVTMGAFGLVVACTLVQLNFTITAICFTLMLLALAYLFLGFFLNRRTKQIGAALPFLAGAHVAAPLIFLGSLALWAGIVPIVQVDNPWFALATLAVGVLLYVITDLLFHWILARWAAAVAFFVTSFCVLFELNVPLTAILMAMMLLAIGYLLVGLVILRRSNQMDKAMPLIAVAQAAVVIAFLSSYLLWSPYGQSYQAGYPWLALAAMMIGVLFYLITDLLYQWILARWAAAIAFGVTVVCILIQLNIVVPAMGFILMLIALAYLLLGIVVYRRTNQLDQALPLLAVSHLAAPTIFLFSLAFWAGIIPQVQRGYPWFALAAMLLGVLFYLITDLAFHWEFSRWVTMGAFTVTFFCVLLQLNIPNPAICLILMLLALAYLLLSYVLYRKTKQLDQALSFLVGAHAIAPLVFLVSFTFWADIIPDAPIDHPWFALAAMLVGVVVYVTTDLLYHWILARWAAAFAFAVTVICMQVQLNFSPSAISLTSLVVALAFLLGGYVLRRRTNQLNQALPLYAAGYAIALYTTFQAALTFDTNPLLLANVLVGDGFLLVISAIIHRQVPWAYGAAWLFIAPVTIYAQVYLPESYLIGLALFALLVIYAAAGFLVGRRTLRLGGAFLSAAAFLSLVVAPLVWTIPLAATLILGVIAALYLLFAIWLGWIWLLLPMLVAVHLAVFSGLDIFFNPGPSWIQALTTAYGTLGVILILVGIGLRRRGQSRWAWPFIAAAVLDLAGAYLPSLALGGWVAIFLSTICATLAFWLAWEEKQVFTKINLPPLLTYLGVFFVFIGHFYLMAYLNLAWTVWPPFTAALCALLVVISWWLRSGEPMRIYGTPLSYAGLSLIFIPSLVMVVLTNTDFLAPSLSGISAPPIPGSILQIITFAIASAVYFAEAAIRRNPVLAYVGGGALVVVICSGLMYFTVDELQAYILPLGLGIILMGWSERHLGRRDLSRWIILSGLLILMGSAFYQSIDSVAHAALLLIESLLALGWGIRIHSRSVVVVAGIALLANAVAQLGPAFIELPRWVHIGLIGALLLGGGLLGLFRRDQLISARRKFTADWRGWQP